MLRALTSRQLSDWMAYAMIEQVGNPMHVEDEKGKRKAKRVGIEAGFKSLMEKQGGN